MMEADMKRLVSLAMLLLVMGSAHAQNVAKLPADVDPESKNRLPLIQPKDMDEATRKVFLELAGANTERPLGSFLGLALYNPSFAQALRTLNRSVVRDGTTGNRAYEAAVLTATRESQFSESEWGGHSASALRAGLAQSTIDVIRDGRELTGVPAEDAIVIRFGRELFRNKRISPETFAKVKSKFGPRGTVELIGIMGDYSLVAMLLKAVDQQLPEDRVLPPLKTR
jgi:4-carboxymuconolactone decarboxylase